MTKNLRLFFPLLSFNLALTCLSQENTPCLFDEIINKTAFVIETEQILQKEINHFLPGSKAGNIRIIPVVIHVIHNGGSENISDSQILGQFDVLKEDFRKLPGTNGDGNGVDSEIEFRLAKLSPDGKCTNGIVRIQSTLTNHQTHQRTKLGELSFWDNQRYLNVYVVKSINNGSAGYSSFPGGPDLADGIVMMHNYFGKTGTASGLGRTLTHEIGHWLGLYHTFNDGCGIDPCLDGDYVCDTPPADSPTNFTCPVKNTCSNDNPDLNDQVENYMDYSSDACLNMFTNGQKTRMDAALNSIRWDIWQPSNVSATGVDSSYNSPPCNVIADFTANGKNICTGSTVVFINKSQNTPVSFQWTFPGGNPSSSTLANPTVVYGNTGNYPVSLVATNSVGTDSITLNDFIVVSAPVPGTSLNYSEGFETTLFPPNGMTVENPDTGITWERDTVASYSGNGSVKINNLINTNYGQGDELILPDLDLTSYSGTPFLSFRWAYARSSTVYSDELIVLLSKDCGLNFTQILYKSGNALATAPVQTTPFIPDSSQWKQAKVTLFNYKNYNNVILKFVNVTDGGNNLYLDNIQVGDTVFSLESEEINWQDDRVNIFPNPSNSFITVEYLIEQAGPVKMELVDISGNTISVAEIHPASPGKYITVLNTSGTLARGIYLLRLTTGNTIFRKKIVLAN